MLSQSASALERWSSWRSLSLYTLLVLLLFESVSGLYLYLVPELGKGPMIMLGLHVLLGVIGLLPFVIFLYKHIRAVYARGYLGDRTDVILRHTAWAGLLASLLTGVYLVFVGVAMHALGWWVHLATSVIGTVTLIVHMAWRTLVIRRRVARPLQALGLRASLGLAAMVGVTVAGLFWWQYATRTVVPEQYETVREDALFEPGQMTTSFTGVARTQQFSNSVACGASGCHQGLYKEWLETPHYRSANPLVLTIVDRVGREVGGHSAQRHCGACHFPIQLITGQTEMLAPKEDPQSGFPITAGAPAAPAVMAQNNPKAVLNFPQDEGSSCVFCHSIGELRKAGGGANVIDLPREYVFADGKPWTDWLYQRAVALKPKAHGRSYTRDFYHESKACAGCHQRLQMESWVHSDYFRAKDVDGHKECQTCHMPDVKLDDEVMVTLKGTTKSHRFPGANLFVPNYYNAPAQAKCSADFLKDDKVLVEGRAPAVAAPGSTLPLLVSVYNKKVGHIYPAGPEIDLVEAWLEVHVKDAAGKEVFSSGVPDAKHHLPADAYVYTMWGFDNFLEPVPEKYGLHHPTWHWTYGLLHVIPAGKVDDVRWQVPLPATLPSGRLHVEVALQQRKPVQTFLDIIMPGQTAPIVTLGSWATDVDVKPGVAMAPLPAPAFVDKPRCDPFYVRRIRRRELFVTLSAWQALMELKQGRQEDAMKRVEQMRQRYGDDQYDLEVAYGITLAKSGKRAEAEAHLESVIDMHKDDTLARDTLADLYDADGRKNDAAMLRAEAAKLREASSRTYFNTREQEVVIDKSKRARDLTRNIADGVYDKKLPFILVNRDRLREVTANGERDWALRE